MNGVHLNDASLPSIIALTLELEAEAQKLKDNIKARLLAMPDNPRINRINERCFTIKASDLGTTNWTPFYQDFKEQYKKLAEVVDKLPLRGLPNKLQEIVKTKKYRDGENTLRFHPDVIKHLANMLGMAI